MCDFITAINNKYVLSIKEVVRSKTSFFIYVLRYPFENQ